MEVVEHRLSEEDRVCDACGAVMEEIGKEVRRSLKMEPARFWIQEDVHFTYACKQCATETGEGSLRKAPRKPTFCPRSFAFPEAATHYDPEICHVLAVVPSGAGVSAAGPEAVPAGHGQLNPAGLGHLAAACVR